MELIDYQEFGRLRLSQFVQTGTPVSETDNWEWMDGIWINEGITGCTSISRHEEMPNEAGGLELSFEDLPLANTLAILETIRLPLRPGMNLQEIESILGRPERTEDRVADRKTLEFTVGRRHRYYVSTTVHETQGLIYVVVIRKDVLSRCKG